MIYGQLGGRHPLATVLAGAVVAEEQVAPVRPQEAARDLDVGKEPDDDNVLTKSNAVPLLARPPAGQRRQ